MENYMFIDGELYFVYANNYFIKVTEHFSISGSTIDSILADYAMHISASA